MIKILLMLIFFSSSAFAGEDYWSIKVPTMTGAMNVSHERDEKFFVISTSYNILIQDTKEIHLFYKGFFEDLGWEDPMKDFPKQEGGPQGPWQSYRTSFNQEGLPEALFASVWKSKEVPASGTVLITLTSFENNKFSVRVKVTISPEVDTSPVFQLSNLVLASPENIFLLHKATGGNPLKVDEISAQPLKGYKNNEVVKEYYSIVEQVYNEYKEFGDKYIHIK